MFINNQNTPFIGKISFEKLIKEYEVLALGADKYKVLRAKKIIEIAQKNPKLIEGFTDLASLESYHTEINFLLEDIFPPLLSKNEIKTLTIPFENFFFNSSQRLKKILDEAGDGFEPKIRNFEQEHVYILACALILSREFGAVDAIFLRPHFYDIPDKNGIMKHYRIMYNADFFEIYPTEKAMKITSDDFQLLMDNFNDIEIWKKKIPPKSWVLKGFVIATIFDVTKDEAISALKSSLLEIDHIEEENCINDFEAIFQSIFNVKDIKAGFTILNEEQYLQKSLQGDVALYLAKTGLETKFSKSIFSNAFTAFYERGEFYAISDFERYRITTKIDEIESLRLQGIQSAIFAPIISDDKIIGFLNLVSTQKGALNSVNANRLKDVMPYIAASLKRSKEDENNLIEAIIQRECTSIHKCVYWRFKKEAKRFLKAKDSNFETLFKEITFKDVFPLYGQVDIKNSSKTRNDAIQKDLKIQLSDIERIFRKAFQFQPIAIFEQILFRIRAIKLSIIDELQVNSEQNILDFLREEIQPMLNQLKNINMAVAKLIEVYENSLDKDTHDLYNQRKNYDQTVTQINKTLSLVLDTEQEKAQAVYPHYFDRYNTDGVEHNMYIGGALNMDPSFNKLYLSNLRLWQLQVICKMENAFYKTVPDLPIKLDIASLVLVHSSPISIRFRMDEKRFDVDGSYNARYEILKKRIDKALIKNSKERVTQKGKLAIIYSQKKEETEYLFYVNFLQSKHILGTNLEIVEVEDLDALRGLKAIKVDILYKKIDTNEEYFTYEDLMNSVKS